MKSFACAVLAAVVFAAASAAFADEPPAADARAMAAVAKGNETFAFALYAKVGGAGGNLFFSPFSVSAALAMTMAGARGNTRVEMAALLGLPDPDEKLHPAFGKLIEDLNSRKYKGRWEDDPDAGRKPFELVIAGSLWGRRGYPFEEGFRKLAAASYGAGLVETDFGADPEKARIEINAWVENKTADRIKDLLSKGSVTELTRLVLVNAVYFKAAWEEPFEKSATAEGPFHVSESATVAARFMRLTKTFRYAKTRGVEILAMPYIGRELNMLVLLPEPSSGIAGLEKDLKPEKLAALLRALKWEDVEVSLPKFRIESALNLKETLESMGMKDAFNPAAADFSGMAGTGEISIGIVVHKAFVEVNEEGTEAAAATAVSMEGESADEVKPVVFKADRPFMFLLRDEKTSSILFIGRVADPTK